MISLIANNSINTQGSFLLAELDKFIQENRPAIELSDRGDVFNSRRELEDHIPEISVNSCRLVGLFLQVPKELIVERHDWLEVDDPQLLS